MYLSYIGGCVSSLLVCLLLCLLPLLPPPSQLPVPALVTPSSPSVIEGHHLPFLMVEPLSASATYHSAHARVHWRAGVTRAVRMSSASDAAHLGYLNRGRPLLNAHRSLGPRTYWIPPDFKVSSFLYTAWMPHCNSSSFSLVIYINFLFYLCAFCWPVLLVTLPLIYPLTYLTCGSSCTLAGCYFSAINSTTYWDRWSWDPYLFYLLPVPSR